VNFLLGGGEGRSRGGGFSGGETLFKKRGKAVGFNFPSCLRGATSEDPTRHKEANKKPILAKKGGGSNFAPLWYKTIGK